MRIAWNNYADDAEMTVSSEKTTLPATNVQHEFRTKIWRSDGTLTSEHLSFDLGESKLVSAAIVLDHNFSLSNGSLFQLRHCEDNWTGVGTLAFEWTPGTNPAHVVFPPIASQHWRIVYTKTNQFDAEVGRVFIGGHEQLPAPEFTGYTRSQDDISLRMKSIGGQTYTDKRETFRSVDLDFTYVSDVEAGTFKNIAESVGIADSFFLVADEVATSQPELSTPIYVKFNKLPKFTVSGHDGGAITWDTSLELEEQL